MRHGSALNPEGASAKAAGASGMVARACWLHAEFAIHRYLMSCASGREDGAEKALRHRELCSFYVALVAGGSVDSAASDHPSLYAAVHEETQTLTDYLDEVIGFPLKGLPDYDRLAEKFFAAFHELAMKALLPAEHIGDAKELVSSQPAVPEAVTALKGELAQIYDAFGIGSAARTLSTLMVNISNLNRRAACLSRIERDFFTFPVADDGEDGEYDEELLKWGDDPDQYANNFARALVEIQALSASGPQPAAVKDERAVFERSMIEAGYDAPARGLTSDGQYLYQRDEDRFVGFQLARASQPATDEPVASGLSMDQEPKYTVRDGRIVNRASGETIPDDEPVFIFRARDALAIEALCAYSHAIGQASQKLAGPAYVSMADHHAAVDCRIADFSLFRVKHAHRMTSPDTAKATASSARPPRPDLEPPLAGKGKGPNGAEEPAHG